MSPRWTIRAGLLAFLGSCKPSDSTAPKVPYVPPAGVHFPNPQTFTSGVAAFETTWNLGAIRSTTGLASAVAMPPGSAPVAAPACAAGRAPISGPSPAVPPLGVIPDSDFGRTFVYDSATAKFVAGADTGGPAGGVRFDLPAVDSLNRVLYPLHGVGTLDLFDLTPTGGPLTVHTVITGTAGNGSADYTLSDTGASTQYAGVLAGQIAGAGHTFTVRDSLSNYLQAFKANAVVGDSGAGNEMTLIATHTQSDPYDYFYDLDFTFQAPSRRVRLKGSITVYCLIPSSSVIVTVNDSDYAIVQIGASGPSITALSDSITPAQDTAILALVRGQNELFAWLEALAQPTAKFLGP